MELDRRTFLSGLGALAACGPTAPPGGGPGLGAPDGRNLVVVLVDDQRWDSLGAAGHPFLETPAIDRLAAEGALFRESFVTTSLCCPSRATLWTGLYAHAHGVLDNRSDLDPGLPTWPALARSAGVETAFFGKWHLGGEDARPRPGWDRWLAFGGQGVYEPRPGAALDRDGVEEPLSGYVTDVLTDELVRWLREPIRTKRPFAAVISHKAAHAPFVPAPRHRDRYADAPVPETLPDTDDAYRALPGWLRRMRHDTEFGVERPYRQWPDFASWYRDYHRTLLAVDESVGRILAALAEAGLASTTSVVYTADNGFMFGEKGVLDKRNFYEPSIRVPLLVRSPGGTPGARPGGLVTNVDLAPTALAFLGLAAPEGWHGRSLVPWLTGTPAEWRQEFLYEYFYEANFPQTPTLFGLRTAHAKLVVPWGTDDPPALYDLGADPQERTDVSLDPAWAERKKALRGRLGKHMDRLGLLRKPVWGRDRAPGAGGPDAEDGG